MLTLYWKMKTFANYYGKKDTFKDIFKIKIGFSDLNMSATLSRPMSDDPLGNHVDTHRLMRTLTGFNYTIEVTKHQINSYFVSM